MAKQLTNEQKEQNFVQMLLEAREYADKELTHNEGLQNRLVFALKRIIDSINHQNLVRSESEKQSGGSVAEQQSYKMTPDNNHIMGIPVNSAPKMVASAKPSEEEQKAFNAEVEAAKADFLTMPADAIAGKYDPKIIKGVAKMAGVEVTEKTVATPEFIQSVIDALIVA
jgi:hypothetical protein